MFSTSGGEDYVEAMYAFSASNKQQLSMKKHEKIRLLQKHDSGWWIGENERAEIGLFPANYVRMLKNDNQIDGAVYETNGNTNHTTPPSPHSIKSKKLVSSASVPNLKINKPKQWKPELIGKSKSRRQSMMEDLGLVDEIENSGEDEDGSDDEEITDSQSSDHSNSQQSALENMNMLKEQLENEQKQSQMTRRQNAVLQNEIKKLKAEKLNVEKQLQEYRVNVGVLTKPQTPQSFSPIPNTPSPSTKSIPISQPSSAEPSPHSTGNSISPQSITSSTPEHRIKSLEKPTLKEAIIQTAVPYPTAKDPPKQKQSNSLNPKLKEAQKKIEVIKRNYRNYKSDVSEQLKSFQREIKSLNSSGIDVLLKQLQDTSEKYKKEMKLRKDLFNQLQDLKGGIRVYLRVRPLVASENTQSCVDCALEENEVKVYDEDHKRYQCYEFDKVFSPSSTQLDVFKDVQPLATSVLDGYNVCIFAYGQTGSGKTYTMEGPEKDRGVNYRTLYELFEMKNEREGDFSYEIKVSVMEIYNETLVDLLSDDKKIMQIMMKGNISIPGLTMVAVNCVEDVVKTLNRGYKNRAVGNNNINEHSSRSHCVVSVYVEGVNKTTGVKWKGKLHLIDLAGSERLKRTNASDERFKESVAINKSLSSLGDVIQALSQKKPHIPFRNSKLTSLLQDSLGGNSKTLMFVNVSPAVENCGETICSLNFASRVRKVELGEVKKNVVK